MLDTLLGLRKRSGAEVARAQYLSPESMGFDWNSPTSWDQFFSSSRESTSGIRVDHKSALCLPAFWEAVNMISDDVASIGYSILRREDPDSPEDMNDPAKVAALDYIHDERHPADYLINLEANDEEPAFEACALWVAHALVCGSGYLYVERMLNGDPLNLLPLMPWRTRPERDKDGKVTGQVGGLYYKTLVDDGRGAGGTWETIRAEDICHLKGLKLWREFGCDPVEYHRDLIGLGQSSFSYAGQFFRRGGRAGGTLVVPPHMKGEVVKKIEEEFRKKYEQHNEHFATIVAREGVKFERQTMSPEEAQLVEGRQADARDVARIFKMPPQKLGLADSVGFASLEQSQRQYLQQTLVPWIKRVTGQFRLRLLTKGQRYKRSYAIGVDVSAIIQLDAAVQTQILTSQRASMLITTNEARKILGMPSIDDPSADELSNPNTTSPGAAAADPASPEDNPPPADGQQPPQDRSNGHVSDAALQRLLTATERRMLSRLCNDAQRHAKTPIAFLAWLETDLDGHSSTLIDALIPVSSIIAECRTDRRHDDALRWSAELRQAVRERLDAFTSPPHAHDQLAANIAAECKRLLDPNAEPILRL